MGLGDLDMAGLRKRMVSHGVSRLLVKELAANDNSKNQPYFAKGTLDVANILPMGPTYVDTSDSGNKILKAPLPFQWLRADGMLGDAPNAKLIFYPQYPEVRFSGFLQGARGAPSELMNSRAPGRLLFLGITTDRRVIGWACAGDSALANNYRALGQLESDGVFLVIPLLAGTASSLDRLLVQMGRIHRQDWIDSKSLKPDGSVVPCRSTQCVGYTLEAELGIARNGRAEPDFEGWEVKAGKVASFASTSQSRRITLFTPEPTGGFYRKHGLLNFVLAFGYRDVARPDRMNFGGIHRAGVQSGRSGLTLQLTGYDAGAGVVSDPSGSIQLVTSSNAVAAEWSYTQLLDLWNGKHNRALYAVAEMRSVPGQQYRYGSRVYVATGTDFNLFVRALANGDIIYDPGIKVEGVSTARPKGKPRSQFRTTAAKLARLYNKFEERTLA